jgi:hypothetical protein
MEQAFRDKIIASVGGGGAHVVPAVALEELTAAQARRRPSKKLATVWDELAHMVFWQELTLEIVRGGQPQTPEHAAGGWPAIPTGRGATKTWRRSHGHATWKPGSEETPNQCSASCS